MLMDGIIKLKYYRSYLSLVIIVIAATAAHIHPKMRDIALCVVHSCSLCMDRWIDADVVFVYIITL